MRRIYFDNAATTFPKPPGVAEAVLDYLNNVGASAGRGAYREAVDSGRMLLQLRADLRRLFNAAPTDHVIFALNGTDALNIAIKSIVREGDHVVTTALDHNSVLRPLSALEKQRGVRRTIVEPAAESTLIDPAAFAAALTSQTTLAIVNHASNVTGALQPVTELAEICRARGVLFLLDAAQSAGHVPIDFSAGQFDLLATPGHKGLGGPLGTGVLLIRAGLEDRLQTVREGGTGSASEFPTQPETLPDKFESGSHNAVGLAGLAAAVRWILSRGVPSLRAHETSLMRQVVSALRDLPAVRWFGPRELNQRVGVFSLCVDGFEPAELAAVLDQEFGLLARAGLHCAPLAHRAIGTAETGGTTRISLGFMHTPDDIEQLGAALRCITAAHRV